MLVRNHSLNRGPSRRILASESREARKSSYQNRRKFIILVVAFQDFAIRWDPAGTADQLDEEGRLERDNKMNFVVWLCVQMNPKNARLEAR